MFIRRFVIVLAAAGFLLALPPSAARGADGPAGATSAVLTFDPLKAVYAPKNTSGYGGYYDPIGCWVKALSQWPRVTVAENGDLSGECTWGTEAASYDGHLTGNWDRATGKVTIQVSDVTSLSETRKMGNDVYPGSISISLEMDGTAEFAGSETVATGTATFDQTCKATKTNQFVSNCTNANPGYEASKLLLEVKGTVPFTLVLGPEETGEPSGAVAGGPTQGDGGSPPVGFIALGAVLAGIAGAAVLEARRRARKPAGLDGAQIAAVTADRYGGFADTMAYGEGAGKAAPGVGKAYEALVVAQAPQATRKAPLVTPDGATAEALREAQRTRTEPPWSRSAGDGGKPPRLTR